MNLQEFLNNNVVEGMTKEVAISDRFRDESGDLLKFKISAMTRKQHEEARKKATKIDKKGNQTFDNNKFETDIVINNTVYPNFKNAESLKAVGVNTAEEYIDKVLLSGEIVRLADEIVGFSGFKKDINELIEEAKN